MKWQYSTPTFSTIPQGNYRARISSVTWDITRETNKQMLVITLKISGQKSTLKHYIVFSDATPNEVNRTNWSIKRFCDAFALDPATISSDNYDLNKWIGSEGGVTIEHRSYKDYKWPFVKTFLTRKQLEFLPPYYDPSNQGEIHQPSAQAQAQVQQYAAQGVFQQQQLPPQPQQQPQQFGQINPEPIDTNSQNNFGIPF